MTLTNYNISDNTRATARTEAVKIGIGIVFFYFYIIKPYKKHLLIINNDK